jgi:hypothetical protein
MRWTAALCCLLAAVVSAQAQDSSEKVRGRDDWIDELKLDTRTLLSGTWNCTLDSTTCTGTSGDAATELDDGDSILLYDGTYWRSYRVDGEPSGANTFERSEPAGDARYDAINSSALYQLNTGLTATLLPVMDGAGTASGMSLSTAGIGADQVSTDEIHNLTEDDVTHSWGDGTPEGSVTADPGSLYIDYTNAVVYLKESGDDTNTGWVDQGVIPSGSDPDATCTTGELYLDTDTSSDTNCTTTADDELCICSDTDTWSAFGSYYALSGYHSATHYSTYPSDFVGDYEGFESYNDGDDTDDISDWQMGRSSWATNATWVTGSPDAYVTANSNGIGWAWVGQDGGETWNFAAYYRVLLPSGYPSLDFEARFGGWEESLGGNGVFVVWTEDSSDVKVYWDKAVGETQLGDTQTCGTFNDGEEHGVRIQFSGSRDDLDISYKMWPIAEAEPEDWCAEWEALDCDDSIDASGLWIGWLSHYNAKWYEIHKTGINPDFSPGGDPILPMHIGAIPVLSRSYEGQMVVITEDGELGAADMIPSQASSGTDPAATCTVGEVYLDTDTSSDTNCTTSWDNSWCLCADTDTWVALDNQPYSRIRSGADPGATCTVGDIYLDTDETDDTNCTTTADNSLCVCTATDTWTALENN